MEQLQNVDNSTNKENQEAPAESEKPYKSKLMLAVRSLAALSVLAAAGLLASYFLGATSLYNQADKISDEAQGEPESAMLESSNMDTDADGFPNEIEKAIGTDPYKADTDGDGYSDFNEIKNGYNPLETGSGAKYQDEEKQAIEEKMKSADADFYENGFIPIDADLVTPEISFKAHNKAYEKKSLAMYLKTLSEITAGELEKEYPDFKNIENWETEAHKKQIEQAKYVLSEQAARLAVMVPQVREYTDISGNPALFENEKVQVPDIYFIKEKSGWKIDLYTVLRDAPIRKAADSKEEEGQIAKLKADWKNRNNL